MENPEKHYVPGAWAILRVVLTVLVILGYWQTHQTNNRLCDATRANRTYIRNAILRGEKTLPTLVYYKQHPLELVKAEQELAQELADLPSDVCS